MVISSIAANAVSNAVDRVGEVAAAIAGAADPANPADTIDISDAAIELMAAKLQAAASDDAPRPESS